MTLADVHIPDCYDTRETFRAKFAACYDDTVAMLDLIDELRDEYAKATGKRHNRPTIDWATLAALREVALNIEHTLYAIAEMEQVIRIAEGQSYRQLNAIGANEPHWRKKAGWLRC